MISIIEALDDPALFRPWFPGTTWNAWRAILKAAFALPMTAEEIAFFRSVADRDPPAERVQELWIVAGRREILVWPYVRQTLSTSPQNTHSILRPFKAVLEGTEPTTAFWSDIEFAMRDLGSDLRLTSMGDDVAKAGRELSAANVKDIQEGLDAVRTALGRLDAMVKRQSKYTADTQSAEGEP
jgi:hypothetical protein